MDTLPLPGRGQTWLRWQGLADVAAVDLSEARLAEGHADAVAILTELGRPELAAGAELGVWAAESKRDPLVAARPPAGAGVDRVAGAAGGGWLLSGTKRWCSGAHRLDAALVTATAPDGPRLFLVELDRPGVAPVEGTWPAVGMADSDSFDVSFTGVTVCGSAAVGGPGDYVNRPGFWHGSVGVAACWYGGAIGVADALKRGARSRPEPHRLAHLGAVQATLDGMAAMLRAAAAEIDADPDDRAGVGERRARSVRYQIERGCTEVLDRVGRATGADPLCHDAGHARRVADLTVYLRQSHAEVDLERLGRLLVDDPS